MNMGRVLVGLLAFGPLAYGAGASGAVAQDFDDAWNVNGSVLGQIEYRDCGGNDAACAFGKNELDGFGELDARFARQVSQFEKWSGSFFGAADASDFRGRGDRLVAERFSLVGERGDTAVPWRVELGDYFGFTSLRTLQLPLKGARAELQFARDGSGPFQSLQVFGGSTARSYNDALSEQGDDTLIAGASHLVEFSGGPSFMATGYTASQDTAQAGTIRNGVFSLSAAHDVSVADHALALEAEIGAMVGESLQGNGTTRKGGYTYATSVSGRNKTGLSYGARFEEFSQTYNPIGAATTPDRRFWEARAGHVFDGIGDAELRYQGFRDGRSTANPTDTDSISLSGSWVDLLEGGGGAGTFDAFWRRTRSDDATTDNQAYSVDVSTNWILDSEWTGIARILGQQTEDFSIADVDRSVVQGDLSAARRVSFGGVRGSVSPGLVLRRETTGGRLVNSAGPRVSGSFFTDDGHSLVLDTSVLFQEGHRGATDTRDVSARSLYSYTDGPHRLSLTGQYRSNDPDPGRFGDAWQVAASYQFSFATRIESGTGAGAIGTGIAQPAGDTVLAQGLPDIGTLALGEDVADAEDLLSQAGRSNPVRIAGDRIYLGRYLDRVEQRQRLVLAAPDGRLAKAGLVIDFTSAARVGRERVYREVLDELVRLYGSPDRVVEDSNFTANLAQDLRDGDFRRIVEWQRPNGVLRFGIPARLDGLVRMELQFARSFPNIGDPFWSLHNIR